MCTSWLQRLPDDAGAQLAPDSARYLRPDVVGDVRV
ncbi:hypothetical protein J2S49_000997 [Arcanobacterium wilhelmae]|uniref:Uncharacterized protein n=1 Tax=Arcanobacterium wilhelmae TaxID=1803177 RepID=A0ABT9NB39_9ACTO|nr:hypothetical protein [Arcanobacterium wilhelmae]